MKKLLLVLVFLLSACAGGVTPVLSPEMTAAINVRADLYDAQFGDDGYNIARICVQTPTALYWNEGIQSYAVACVVPNMPNMYGIVMLDAHNVVLNVEHINADSLTGLEGLISGLGWKRLQ